MCIVNIKVDDAAIRQINPELTSRESINQWLQQQVDVLIDDLLGCQETLDLETARAMLHDTIRKEYAAI